MNRKMIIALAVLLVAALGLSSCTTRDEAPITPEYEQENMAPDFTVPLLTGETFTLSEHRGTVVVLSFWATWCGPCVAKMPTTQALWEQHGGDVIFVGMNLGEDQSRVQDFIDERGFTFPIALDENADIHRTLYPAAGIPYTVVIGKDGTIIGDFLGGGTASIEGIEAAIAEALR